MKFLNLAPVMAIGLCGCGALEVVSDSHAAEDIFQNVALKAMTRDVVSETGGALLSWAFITARREGIDWLREHRREAQCLDVEILDLLDREWSGRRCGEKVEVLKDCIESAGNSGRDVGGGAAAF